MFGSSIFTFMCAGRHCKDDDKHTGTHQDNLYNKRDSIYVGKCAREVLPLSWRGIYGLATPAEVQVCK